MNAQTQRTGEEDFAERQLVSELFYLNALAARKTGLDVSAQIRAGLEAVINYYTA